MKVHSVLIILFGAIGDVTQALPVAMRIKKAYPDCRISWAVEPPSRVMVEDHPAVDRVLLFDRPKGLAGYRAFVKQMRAEHYDVVLDMQRHLKSGFTSFLSRGKIRVGFHRRNSKEFNWLWNNKQIGFTAKFAQKIFTYQLFGDFLGLPEMKPLEYGVNISSEQRAEVTRLLEESGVAKNAGANNGYVAFVIGASWKSRLWPVEHYAVAAEAIWNDFRLIPVIVGGRSEFSNAAEIQRRVSTPIVNIVEKTSLRILAAVFEQCRFVLGSDTGPSHIAAACGRRVISLWGPTSPGRSAPYQSEEFALQSAVGCSPCYQRVCPGLNTICMSSIPPAAVIARVQEVVAHVS